MSPSHSVPLFMVFLKPKLVTETDPTPLQVSQVSEPTTSLDLEGPYSPGCWTLPARCSKAMLILSGWRLMFSKEVFSCIPFFFFFLFRIASATYGGSQARGRIEAAAASLHHSHSNVRSQPCLRPTPQLTATLDPQPTERG